MLTLIAQFNVAEILWAEIKSKTQVDMALETLPDMFPQFKISYNMSLTELMKKLQNIKNVLMTKNGDALALTSAGPSSSKTER